MRGFNVISPKPTQSCGMRSPMVRGFPREILAGARSTPAARSAASQSSGDSSSARARRLSSLLIGGNPHVVRPVRIHGVGSHASGAHSTTTAFGHRVRMLDSRKTGAANRDMLMSIMNRLSDRRSHHAVARTANVALTFEIQDESTRATKSMHVGRGRAHGVPVVGLSQLQSTATSPSAAHPPALNDTTGLSVRVTLTRSRWASITSRRLR